MIQVAQKLLQEPEAADAALQTFFGALRAAIIVLFQPAKKEGLLILYPKNHSMVLGPV